ncbi:MAG TPA: hypothetical protein VFQ45_09340 [Longimicrobium sp.]|nr:hypothetical protein [Longimicrobium sp.]
MKTRTLLALAVLCLAPPLRAQAAAPADTAVHPRVRVWVPEMGGAGPLQGRLAALGPDKLVLIQADSVTPDARRVDIPLTLVARMEKSRGWVHPSARSVRRSTVRGALAGLLVGAGVGVVLGISSASEGHEGNAEAIPVLAAGLTLAGGAAGFVIGARGYEEWVPVPLPGR